MRLQPKKKKKAAEPAPDAAVPAADKKADAPKAADAPAEAPKVFSLSKLDIFGHKTSCRA